jgi:hypothetical protein
MYLQSHSISDLSNLATQLREDKAQAQKTILALESRHKETFKKASTL